MHNQSESTEAKLIEKDQVKFQYRLADMVGMKIALLINISRLPIQIIQFTNQDQPSSKLPKFILKSGYWELTNEYQIIHYIVSQSVIQSRNKSNAKINQDGTLSQEGVISLCSEQGHINARMAEKLIQLRSSLFPLMNQFYRYVLGHQKTKKTKYQSLNKKIKKQIGKLDDAINQFPEIFKKPTYYLNLIITCELFMGCSLVFQDKFRKAKSSLFDMYENTSNLKLFQDIYGKTKFSSNELVPQQFKEQDEQLIRPDKQDLVIPANVIKLSDISLDSSRNDLLYNFFSTMLMENSHSKKQYFNYFWMMFDELNCSLVEIAQCSSDLNFTLITQKINNLHHQLLKFKSSLDYGFLGAYQHQKDNTYQIKGILCLASKTYQQFISLIHLQNQLGTCKLAKIDVKSQDQRKKVQMLWQHTQQNHSFDNVNVRMIKNI